MPRVLAVDDDPDILVTLETLLEGIPEVEFRGFESGDAARVAIADWVPDVALVDMRLGPDSGAEFLRFLADACPSTRRVILSGYDGGALTTLGILSTDAHATIQKDHLVTSVKLLEQVIGTRIAGARSHADAVSNEFFPAWLF
jgi:DNA-binding NarL/FixJ family response regulator